MPRPIGVSGTPEFAPGNRVARETVPDRSSAKVDIEDGFITNEM
jgi:hypothetical protein